MNIAYDLQGFLSPWTPGTHAMGRIQDSGLAYGRWHVTHFETNNLGKNTPSQKLDSCRSAEPLGMKARLPLASKTHVWDDGNLRFESC